MLLQQLGKSPELVRPEDHVDHWIGHLDLIRHVLLLDHTAADGNYLVRLGLLGVIQCPDVSEHSHLSVLSDGAGVYDYDIGRKLVLGEGKAHLGQISPYLLRIGLVLLAAVGIDHCERMVEI